MLSIARVCMEADLLYESRYTRNEQPMIRQQGVIAEARLMCAVDEIRPYANNRRGDIGTRRIFQNEDEPGLWCVFMKLFKSHLNTSVGMA